MPGYGTAPTEPEPADDGRRACLHTDDLLFAAGANMESLQIHATAPSVNFLCPWIALQVPPLPSTLQYSTSSVNKLMMRILERGTVREGMGMGHPFLQMSIGASGAQHRNCSSSGVFRR